METKDTWNRHRRKRQIIRTRRAKGYNGFHINCSCVCSSCYALFDIYSKYGCLSKNSDGCWIVVLLHGFDDANSCMQRCLYGVYYVLCSRLFENIVSDPNHELKALLPPDYDNSRYNLRRQRHFNMPKLCTNRTSNTLYMRCRNSSGCSFYPSYIPALYFNMNELYIIFNTILKSVFDLLSRIHLKFLSIAKFL